MKIGIIGDTHFGYPRFEEDSFIQGENALQDAQKKADLIIIAGDVFDTKIPKMETIERTISILKNIEKPIIAVHGNHERRSRDMVNALKLLDSAGKLAYLHNTSKIIEINNEKINIVALGNVPCEYAKVALDKVVEANPKKEGMLNILITHQNINELSIGEEELSVADIENIPYDLVINGHIHKHQVRLSGKLLIPGSTVVTQLKEDETEKRGYILYDTATREFEFVQIPSREFKILKLDFKDSSINEIEERIKEIIQSRDGEKIVKIIVNGTLKEGVKPSDLSFPEGNNIFIENKLNVISLRERLEKLKISKEESLPIKEMALREIEKRTNGKISFNSRDFFEKLVLGVEEAEKYIDEVIKT